MAELIRQEEEEYNGQFPVSREREIVNNSGRIVPRRRTSEIKVEEARAKKETDERMAYAKTLKEVPVSPKSPLKRASGVHAECEEINKNNANHILDLLAVIDDQELELELLKDAMEKMEQELGKKKTKTTTATPTVTKESTPEARGMRNYLWPSRK